MRYPFSCGKFYKSYLFEFLGRLDLLDEHGPLETVDVVEDAHQEEPVAVTHPLEYSALKVIDNDITI